MWRLVENWSKISRKLVENCWKIAEKLVKNWWKIGQKLVENWWKIGQKWLLESENTQSKTILQKQIYEEFSANLREFWVEMTRSKSILVGIFCKSLSLNIIQSLFAHKSLGQKASHTLDFCKCFWLDIDLFTRLSRKQVVKKKSKVVASDKE